MTYQYFVKGVTLTFMSAAAVGAIIVAGFVVRVCWEAFVFGFLGLGYWLL